MSAAILPKLRPLGLPELLDQSIRLYRRNFVTFVGIVAVVMVPLTLLQLLVSLSTIGRAFEQVGEPGVIGQTFLAGFAGMILVGLASLILIQGVAASALTRAAADSYLGESTGILETFRKLGRSWLTLLGALGLALLLGLVMLLWGVVPCIGWVTGFGVLMFFWSAVVPLIAPVVVLEKVGARRALRRAWDLSRRRFWWVLGFMLVLYAFSLLIVSGPAILLQMSFTLLAGQPATAADPQLAFAVQTAIQSLVSLVTSVLFIPLQLAAVTLLYFDLRVRTEGFDIAMLAASASGEAAAPSDVLARAPHPPAGPVVTGKEIAYFALVSVAAGGLFFVLYIALFGLMLAILGIGMQGAGLP